MNLELIRKYLPEFNSYVKGQPLLIGFKRSAGAYEWKPLVWEDWENGLIGDFIIINDEYVEFRKALAEGKTVQYNFGSFGLHKHYFPNVWKDLNLSIGILSDRAHPENYRIKPEPIFKTGDWVYIPELDGNPCEYREDLCCLGLEKWEPKADEVHWFSRNKDEEPVLGKFVETEHWRNTTTYKICTSPGANWTCSYFEYCEPFIGTLPTKWRNK